MFRLVMQGSIAEKAFFMFESVRFFLARDTDCDLNLFYGNGDCRPSQKNGIFEPKNEAETISLDPAMFWGVLPGKCREIEITYKD